MIGQLNAWTWVAAMPVVRGQHPIRGIGGIGGGRSAPSRVAGCTSGLSSRRAWTVGCDHGRRALGGTPLSALGGWAVHDGGDAAMDLPVGTDPRWNDPSAAGNRTSPEPVLTSAHPIPSSRVDRQRLSSSNRPHTVTWKARECLAGSVSASNTTYYAGLRCESGSGKLPTRWQVSHTPVDVSLDGRQP
jgi:hypothetical protein